MSANEQPVSSPAAQEVDRANEEKRLLLKETLIAGSALVLMIVAVVLYFAFFSRTRAPQPAMAEVSAAEWIGQPAVGPAGASAPDHAAPPDENSAADPSREGEDLYSPTDESPSPAQSGGDEAGMRHGTVLSGVPVITSLQRLGLSVQQAHALISALDGVYDFRKARPGQSFELAVGDDGEPSYFAYHVSRTEVYVVKRTGDGLKGRQLDIPTVKKIETYGGTIASSLYKALSDLKAHPSLAGMMVDVLVNEVDFFKEQRPGDTFRVAVEAEYLDGEFLRCGPVLALEYNGVKSGKNRLFRFAPDKGRTAYYNAAGISQPYSVISIPLHYTRLSSRFGNRYHPILKRKKFHNGVDFAAGMGAPVWACRDGEVTLAGRYGANGNLVVIKHDEDLQSIYAHLQRFASGIKVGTTVRERQVIGYVGSTGRSTGPHLHFGLKKNGRFIDPLKYKVQPGRPVLAKYRAKLKAVVAEMGQLLDRTKITGPSEPLAAAHDGEDEVLGLED